MRGFIQWVARFLHIGQLPDAFRSQIDADGGLLWLEQGTPVTAILQSFKAPGVRCGYRKMSFIGYVALSHKRLIVSASFCDKVGINLPYTDPRFETIAFGVTRKRLSMSFNADGLIPDTSGQVTLRISVSDPSTVASILREKGAGACSNQQQRIAPLNSRMETYR